MRILSYTFIFLGILLLIPLTGFAWDYPLSLDITKVSFNYTGNGVAITLRKNNGENIISAPEWYANPGGEILRNDHFAFIKGDVPAGVKASFASSNPDPTESVEIAVDTCSATSGDGFENYTGWSLNNGTITFPSGPLETEGTFNTHNGTSVKSSVGKCRTKFLWKIVKVNGTAYSQDIGYTIHDYYTLLSSPSSFAYYTYNETGIPWTDALDLACGWASGQTTREGCIPLLTDSLYNYSKIKYIDQNKGYFAPYDTNILYFKVLLDSLDNQNETKLDCYALSSFLNVLSYSIGFPFYNNATIKLTPSSSIITNSIRPAHWTYDETFTWGAHQIISFIDSYYSEYVADPSAKVYQNGSLILAKGDITYNTYLPLLTSSSVTKGSRAQTYIYHP
ncbi:MAG: hypothetical protein Q8O92_01600 [Candidatus Latescibacter sp.]|nr:hypothetical protein [Candidatus Latescibacter sp.]